MAKVSFKRDASNGGIPLPSYATPGAAGMDIRSNETATIAPGCVAAVGTGLFLEIPEGYEGQVRPRSGLAFKHGVTILNAPGTIDSDYRGELRVILINHGREAFHIEPGDRIAQIVFQKIESPILLEVDELPATLREEAGFGSSGR